MGRSIEEINKDIKRNKKEGGVLFKELNIAKVENGTYLDEWDEDVQM